MPNVEEYDEQQHNKISRLYSFDKVEQVVALKIAVMVKSQDVQ
ncbi:hypothetical protein [Clostridium beijerinckii]|nr:hypothetical protein [Clostridium beijerinckii]NRY61756.1 hypothetical protein [Clostridium beijerinckii]